MRIQVGGGDADPRGIGGEATLAEQDARISDAQIDVFRALGGGWQELPVK